MNGIDLKGRDLVSIKDFSKKEIERILAVAEEMESIAAGKSLSKLLEGKILATLFLSQVLEPNFPSRWQ